MDKQALTYILALQMVENVGGVNAKNLVAYCGSAEQVFRQKKEHLIKIPGIGAQRAANIKTFKGFDDAEKEIAFAEKNGIRFLYFFNDDYPTRLKDIPDSPLLLFYKGNADLNHPKILAIVGTRKASDYGRGVVERITEELKPFDPLIVSGLAYGIDVISHKSALKNGIPTIGVMGTGMGKIYPSMHQPVAKKMVENGGLLTEYFYSQGPDSKNFPARNRIVAGMSDAVLVVESGKKGGSLITAEIANSYNREVFAVPGRTSDANSSGCNHLVKVNKAYLVETAADISYYLGWDDNKQMALKSKAVYKVDSPQEQNIIDLLKKNEKSDFDNLVFNTGLSPSELSVLLLDMEFKGNIQALPGKFFRLS